MDLGDPRTMSLFLELYGSLPRAGPGSDADTRRALGHVGDGEIRTVLDLGCGPGAQTVTLAEALPDATILALDLLPQMVAETGRRIVAAGLDERVRADVGDMNDPPVPTGSQNLIWCEGAIYNVGVEAGLRRWRRILTAGGSIAFTEPVWLTVPPPAELAEWWLAEYPSITDSSGVEAAISASGFECTGSFVLQPDAWWDDYYGPMSEKIPAFLTDHPADTTAAEIAAAARREIDIFDRFSDCYGSAFFVVQPR